MDNSTFISYFIIFLIVFILFFSFISYTKPEMFCKEKGYTSSSFEYIEPGYLECIGQYDKEHKLDLFKSKIYKYNKWWFN